jgi:hypothetical protein
MMPFATTWVLLWIIRIRIHSCVAAHCMRVSTGVYVRRYKMCDRLFGPLSGNNKAWWATLADALAKARRELT